MIDSPWLLPALVLNTLSMSLVFGLSWLVLGRYPLPYFAQWVRSAGWRAVSSAAGTMYALYVHLPWLSLISIGGMIAGSLCLLDSALAYRGKAPGRAWRRWTAGAFMAVSIGLVALYGHLPEVFYLPAFELLALAQGLVAVAFWPRRGEAVGLGARVVSASMGTWCAMSTCYPFVIGMNPGMLAPTTTVSALLTITAGMGMIVHLLEQSLAREQALGREFQAANQDLGAALHELAASRSEAELYTSVAREQEALVRQIVHDLRNSTQALHLIAEAIEEETVDNARVQAHVGALDRQLTFISTFLKQKLAWIVDRSAAADTGTEVGTALESIAATYGPILGSKGQALVIEPSPSGATLRISGIELEQVLGNLVQNAHQHCPPGARVRLWCVQSDGWATFYVADDGPGIPPERQAGLGRTPPRADGTGVGLRNVYDLVTRAGGSFGVVSARGEGTRFHVTLPLMGWGEGALTAAVPRVGVSARPHG